MPWKLLCILILIAVVIALIGFNSSNVSDVSFFGLYLFREVPIVITMGVSFLVGAFTSILYMFFSSDLKSNKVTDQRETGEDKADEKKSTQEGNSTRPKLQRIWNFKRRKKSEEVQSDDTRSDSNAHAKNET